MSRILIFVDDDTTSKLCTGINPAMYYGIGLGSEVEILPVSQVATWDPKDGDELTPSFPINELRDYHLRLVDGDRALIVGKKAWDILCMVYHNGLRSENGFDASLLDRLGLNCGAYIKVVWKDKTLGMDSIDFNYFLSDDFVKKFDLPYKQVVISTYDRAMVFLDYLDSLNDAEFGFDYETNGMADIPDFEITGCSICTVNYGAFFSFTDIRENSTPEEYRSFCSRFSKFIVNHQSRIWAYNLQFEQQVSFRYFGIIVELCDSAVYNIVEGYHSKRYSLKWTAQRVLNSRNKVHSGIKSWDELRPVA